MQARAELSKALCRECRGEGRTPVRIKQANGRTRETLRVCPACMGSGRRGYLTK